MSIVSEIERIQSNISDVYTTLENQGVKVPSTKNSDNLNLTVSNSIPRIPANVASLAIWLDGDCNTRNGLDRSKNYFENLVWVQPYTVTNYNLEDTTQFKNNYWDGNLLQTVDGGGFYNMPPKFTATSECTIEIVLRLNSYTFPENSEQYVFYPGGAEYYGGPGLINVGNDGVLWVWNRLTTGSNNLFVIGKLPLNKPVYTYFRIFTNSMDSGIPGENLHNSINARPIAHQRTHNTGLTTGATISTAPKIDNKYPRGNIAIGMVRYWGRALSNDEIQANYLDAKTRFNCT